MATKKPETVHQKTFEKWPFKEEFRVLATDSDGNITKLQCKICADNLAAIRAEAARRNVKGAAFNGIVNLADGVECVHRGNLSRHIKPGGLHDWAKQRFGKSPVASTSSAPQAGPPSGSGQRRIDILIDQTSSTAYRHLFNTALCIVRHERPFSDFRSLVTLQRKNGIKLLSGKDTDKCCRQFVSIMAAILRQDIAKMLLRSNFFSGLMDGSQARKTGSEKELIYAKIAVNGCTVELLVKCQDMAEIGGEDARSLKQAYDQAFLDSCEVPKERHDKLMVSICTDGASVNMGKYNGACTQLKAEREWLLVVHCSNHRLELAIKDAFASDKSFEEVDEIMTQMYYHFRNSGKAKRIFTATAIALGVTCVAFTKAHGTRFQNHKYRACKAMVINFLPLCLYCENMIETPGACKTETVAKLRGYLRKFLSYSYLSSLNFYMQVLRVTAQMSYVLQTPTSLITDVIESISEAKTNLRELTATEEDLPFDTEGTAESDSVKLSAKATNLPATLAFKEKLNEKQKRQVEKYCTIVKQDYDIKFVRQGKANVRRVKETLIPAISEAIDARFAPFLSEQEIYASVQIADHRCWDFEEKTFGLDKIQKLSEHFQEPLGYHEYDMKKAQSEFRQLKAVVAAKYRKFRNPLQLWKTVFQHYVSKYPNILLLIELCLCFAWSSATVERGFSVCGRTLTDARTSMSKGTLDDLLVLRINLPSLEKLDSEYETSLVDRAVSQYLSTPRRKSGKAKQVAKSGGSSEPGPAIMPTPFSSSRNPLLEDDSHLYISETDSDADSVSDDSEISDVESVEMPMEFEEEILSD
ncbi:zinc finger protein 862-like [Liolophura sinensis]|uniref:zinc finger protein 862-like n=1 Tax=Liolophura sinensis TaxID=3198878 RepID=UPI0031581FF1